MAVFVERNPLRLWRAWRLRRACARMVADPHYVAGVEHGRPRSGHPEGTVRAHIVLLEANLGRLAPRLRHPDTIWALRCLIHAHDTFKGSAEPDVAIRDPRSHASLARAFMSGFVRERDLLATVQFHDEGRAIWLLAKREPAAAAARFEDLLRAIRDWDLFLAFVIVDTCTPGKSLEVLEWLVDAVRGRRRTRVDRGWILPL
jgi:hypothetical protein